MRVRRRIVRADNPNGIATSSPRLARQRLPWVIVQTNHQPQRGYGKGRARWTDGNGRNRVAVGNDLRTVTLAPRNSGLWARIPLGFSDGVPRQSQRDCDLRPKVGAPAPTLGHRSNKSSTATRLWRMWRAMDGRDGRNRVAVGNDLRTVTQGSSCLATLGFGSESRWDSQMRQQAWRRRVEVLRDAGRQLRTFNPEKTGAGRA